MIVGLTFGDIIKAYLFNAITVAIALIVGGFYYFVGWTSSA